MAFDPWSTPGTQKQNLKWNYSKPNDPDYTTQVTGDIVEIRQIQTKNHMTGQYETWPDGNPKLSMLLVIDSDQLGGEFGYVFIPKGNAADAIRAGLRNAGIPDNTWANLQGKNITIMTNNDGAPYGSGRPRPWVVSVNGEGTKPFRGMFPFEPKQNQQAPQGNQMAGQPVQQNFANPQLQQAFNNASQAMHAAQFNTPQQRPQQYQQNPQYQQLNQAAQQGQQFQQQGGWADQDYYSSDVPF